MMIVLEGIDGSGKGTQAKLLKPDFGLAFPRYDHFFGRIIKFCLHLPWGQKVNPYFLAWLFATDRCLAKGEINSWLKQGKMVVIDRFTGSSQAHQGAKLNDGLEQNKLISWIDWLENKIYRLPKADKVFFLNLPPEKTQALMARRKRNQDAAEKDLAYQKRTYKLYRRLAKAQKWIIINSLDKQGRLLKPKEIHERIKRAID